ncbi:type II inositol 1,4,5-trisphosphate 5-phosphatase-like [Corticium candelabrum]|uniref:type II inositol 1,4,5-trisphosphate 5-phosphatase-like n=1 Tax=Corticium candelabrum TaxID=121492 RepID=UPI002E26D41E|nr:type II inositol 1,4,5-trisphosphate 5-phosphatase-like [Corticium candelabrum]
MDDAGIVQAQLSANETCSNLISGYLVDGDVRRTKILAIVAHEDETALFLFDSTGVPGSSSCTLLLDQTLPIRRKFGYSLRKDSAAHLLNMDIVIDVTTDLGGKLVFELPNNTQMAQFLASMQKASYQMQKMPDSQLLFSWLDGYQKPHTSSTSNDPPVGDLLNLDSPMTATPLSNDMLLFGGETVTPTVESSNVVAIPVEALPVQQEQAAEEWPWSEITRQWTGDRTPVAVSTLSAVKKATVAERLLDAPGSSSTGRLYSSNNGAYVKYTVPQKPRVRNRDSGFITSHLKARENEYTEVKPHRVFCGTWNVNGQPVTEGLHDWLGADSGAPDIYAVGFQELDLSAEALLLNDSSRENEWQRQVEVALHRKGRYYKLKSLRLVGMLLIVFVHEKLKLDVKNVQAVAQGTGILGLMGNKGGVAVRFNLHNTSICFVNSHLAAHIEEVERRNQDYADICSKVQFSNSQSILDHDVVIWMGDLNYRLAPTQQVTESRLKEMALMEKCEELLQHDQLLQQVSLQNVFHGFMEGLIRFKPTYKFDPGTDNLDSSEKARPPAWCDRVLWKATSSLVNLKSYRCHPSLKLSDHKPVSALFDVGIKIINKSRQAVVLSDLHQQLDKLENDIKPVVSLNTLEVTFKSVKFGHVQTQEIIVKNTGQSHADFQFKSRPEQDKASKSWLILKPTSGFIAPGKQQRIALSVYVSVELLPDLNDGKETLEDILVFHVEGGADSFITVKGNFLQSCFGTSLSKLVTMNEFVRQPRVAKLIEFDEQKSNETEEQMQPTLLSIPKEVWMLIDYMYKYGLITEGLFTERGLRHELGTLIEILDTGVGELACSVHTAAEALLLFLEAFPEPVIPVSFHQKCMDCCNNYTLCKQLLMRLPVEHRNLFKYLAAFLREQLTHSDMNKLDAKTLATIFGSVCLRSPPDPAGKANSRRQLAQVTKKKSAFFYNFLINEYDD